VSEGQGTRIRVCGRLTVELQGRRLEDELRGRQGRILLAYLVMHRDRPVRRDELAEALWSGKGAPPAYDSLLAPPLSRLRKTLGPGVLEGRSELALVLAADAWVDWEVVHHGVRTARQALATGDDQTAWDHAQAALEIAQGGLLPGLEAPWIDAKRGELADLRVEALEAVAAAGARLKGAALPEAEQAARAAVQAEPFRESARVALMQVLRARGNVAEALRVYEDVRVLLREELGAAPGAGLMSLHEQLLRDEPAPQSAAPAQPRIPAAGLVERDREVALLDTLLSEARVGEGRAVLVEGPPGIGKSRLLAEFRRRASAAGALVLNARAGELETEFPFGVVRQLFEAAVADPHALAGAAGAAQVVFATPDNGVPPGGDASFAALHGLYWLALTSTGWPSSRRTR
jgi:DNA-binding SARP family transcriptional activator